MTNLPVEFLEWDSNFFNKRIGRIVSPALTQAEMKAILDWVKLEKINCLYYLASGLEKNAAAVAEANGFHFVDLRVTYNKDLRKPEKEFIPKWHIRRAVDGDLDTLKEMARGAFPLSRFKVDPNFNQEKADQMYEVWIENDLRQKGHDVWVIDADTQLAAFTSVSSKTEGKAQIGLVGTQESWRGKGLSLELQRFISEQLRNEDIAEVEVVTQGRNIPAQNLYQRAGYYVRSIDLWYHKWFD